MVYVYFKRHSINCNINLWFFHRQNDFLQEKIRESFQSYFDHIDKCQYFHTNKSDI